jgi:hypothetical protein
MRKSGANLDGRLLGKMVIKGTSLPISGIAKAVSLWPSMYSIYVSLGITDLELLVEHTVQSCTCTE